MIEFVSQNPLFFAFFFPAVMDGIITLLGQHKEYWKKSGRAVNEASPAYYVLRISPWLFVFGSIVWFICWYYVFTILSEPLKIFITLLFIVGHAWGSSSWIMKMMKERGIYTVGNQQSIMVAWGIIICYFSLIAFFATYSVLIYFNH